jgi:hypothetical protein
MVKESKKKDAARDFLNFALSPAGKDSFKKVRLYCSGVIRDHRLYDLFA